MVHQDEPKETSEPLGIAYVFIFVEHRTLLHECSALTCKVNKLLTCLTTESTFICQRLLKYESMVIEVIVASEGLYDLA